MKQDNINYFMVGSLVLGVLVLLLVVLVRLTGQQGDTESYYVTYNTITGIKRGSAVTFGGYQIGQVDAITPVNVDGSTRFKLELAVQQGWPIPQNSTARIISPGLLSDPQVDISEGSSPERLSPGGTLHGREAANLFAAMDTVAYEFQDLSEHSIKPLLKNLSQRIDSVSHRIDDIGGDLDEGVPQVITRVNTLLSSLNRSAGQLETILGDNNQQHISSLFKNADQMSAKLLDLSQSFDKVVAQLDQMLDSSNKLLQGSSDDVRQSVISLRNALHVVSQNIDTIMYNLNASSRNVNEFSHEIRNNPSVLLRSNPSPDGMEGQ
jgi:phospholipid/cholesterol/gamma-HCH transport system substrate-binding protein